jgi:predicted DNA repair protein MutK
MASSLLALIDDIATVLDDVAILTKVAAKKTAGVLGDDLALNAQQVAGVSADRELPVVWAVCKGSLLNKLILVPAALAISIVLPWAITPLLMALTDPSVDLVALEKDKIKGAIRTDFILSAEIIAITLGTVQNSVWTTQLTVLAGVAVLMTVGVYGVVAGIVKIDDAGLYLSRQSGTSSFARGKQALGRGLLRAAPILMKVLSVAGTAAMFLVGGGILVHGLPFLHHLLDGMPLSFVGEAVVGVAAGALVLLGVLAVQRILKIFK